MRSEAATSRIPSSRSLYANSDSSDKIECQLRSIPHKGGGEDGSDSLDSDHGVSADGHLVGSIGEVLVADAYGLELLPASAERHDACSTDGRNVQIKATQRGRFALSGEPDYLIAIRIERDGSWEEIYNGPGAEPWAQAGKMQKNGQRPISIARLRDLAEKVPASERIPRRR